MSRSRKSRMKPYPCTCHRPKSEVLPPGDRRALADAIGDLVAEASEEPVSFEDWYEDWLEREAFGVPADEDPHLAVLAEWSGLRGEANRAVLGDDSW